MAATRNTYYATICYPESAKENWIEILRDLHIQALISPLHDKDIDKEGKPKKAHYHVILMFESLKSVKQAQEIANQFGGVQVIPICSLGAYSRYLCHQDDKDKAQYKKEDVTEISGANYDECCRRNDGEKKAKSLKELVSLTQLILENNILYFHEVADIVIKEHEDWFETLTSNAFYIRSVVMSLATQKIRKEIL